MTKKDIGEKIKRLREGKGLAKNALANLAGISSNYVADIEKGDKCPTVETLSYICFALGLTLKEFFSEEETTGGDKVSALSKKQREALNAFLDTL